ncbi:MAG: DUF3298 domain-containing protein [Ignavibacteriaceae bacterium]
MKKIFTLLFILNSLLSPAQPLPDNFYKRFEGTINDKYNITLNLVRIDSALTGNYYYNNRGELINFIRSSMDNIGNIYLEEDAGYDENYNSVTTGIFKGRFITDSRIEGIWEKPDGSKKMAFYLDEKYPEGSVRTDIFHYSRTYTNYGQASIDITNIEIKNYIKADIQDSINSRLSNAVLQGITFDESKTYTTTDDLMDDFINTYITTVVSDSVNYTDYIPRYEYNCITKILYNSDYLLSLKKIDYSFLGGAHPNTFIEFLNFDLNSGKLLQLDDIFKHGYNEILNKTGELKFREYFQLEADEPLDSAGFWFENGFQLNENFTLTKAGILFLFNAYEIGPYVLGAPEVYIPFSEIKELIKEDSIVGFIQ